jgi:hypothetical protein
MKKTKKAKVEFDIDAIMADPSKKAQLRGFLEEAVLCKRNLATENEAIKDIRTEAIDTMGISGKLFNKLVKTMYKDDFENERTEYENFESAMEAITA